MKTTAYICDRCGGLFDAEFIEGVRIHVDMFDVFASYPVIEAAKADVHFCCTCYVERVVNVARADAGRNNEELYKSKIKELAYLLKQTCVKNRYKK